MKLWIKHSDLRDRLVSLIIIIRLIMLLLLYKRILEDFYPEKLKKKKII